MLLVHFVYLIIVSLGTLYIEVYFWKTVVCIDVLIGHVCGKGVTYSKTSKKVKSVSPMEVAYFCSVSLYFWISNINNMNIIVINYVGLVLQNSGIEIAVGVTKTMTTTTIEVLAAVALISLVLTTRVAAAAVVRAANRLVCTPRRQTYRVQLCFRRRLRQQLLDASDNAPLPTSVVSILCLRSTSLK